MKKNDFPPETVPNPPWKASTHPALPFRQRQCHSAFQQHRSTPTRRCAPAHCPRLHQRRRSPKSQWLCSAGFGRRSWTGQGWNIQILIFYGFFVASTNCSLWCCHRGFGRRTHSPMALAPGKLCCSCSSRRAVLAANSWVASPATS